MIYYYAYLVFSIDFCKRASFQPYILEKKTIISHNKNLLERKLAMPSKSMCSSETVCVGGSSISSSSLSIDMILADDEPTRKSGRKRLKRLFDLSTIFSWNRSKRESKQSKKLRRNCKHDNRLSKMAIENSFVSLEAPVLLQVFQSVRYFYWFTIDFLRNILNRA